VDGAKADIDPVPGVDEPDQQSELHLLLLSEVPAQHLVGIVRRMGLGHQRQSLGPAERCPLAVGIKRGLAPRAEKIQPFLGLAMPAGIGCVIVDAEGTSVDLRGPHHDKFLQQRFQTIVLNGFSEVDPRLHCCGTGSEGVQSWCHRHLLSGAFGDMTSWNRWM
jgi:hypothetical protein